MGRLFLRRDGTVRMLQQGVERDDGSTWTLRNPKEIELRHPRKNDVVTGRLTAPDTLMLIDPHSGEGVELKLVDRNPEATPPPAQPTVPLADLPDDPKARTNQKLAQCPKELQRELKIIKYDLDRLGYSTQSLRRHGVVLEQRKGVMKPAEIERIDLMDEHTWRAFLMLQNRPYNMPDKPFRVALEWQVPAPGQPWRLVRWASAWGDWGSKIDWKPVDPKPDLVITDEEPSHGGSAWLKHFSCPVAFREELKTIADDLSDRRFDELEKRGIVLDEQFRLACRLLTDKSFSWLGPVGPVDTPSTQHGWQVSFNAADKYPSLSLLWTGQSPATLDPKDLREWRALATVRSESSWQPAKPPAGQDAPKAN